MRTSTLSGPLLLITHMAVSAADTATGTTASVEPTHTANVTTVNGLVRRVNMEGSCWSLQTPSGHHYELTGGDIDLYRDGQFVRVHTNKPVNRHKAACDLGPVLHAADYNVLEADVATPLPVLSRR